MIIIIPISDFSNKLFPNIKNNKENLINEIEAFYSVGSVKPKVKVENNIITIEIDVENIQIEQAKFNSLIELCNKGNFKDALPIATELVKQFPSNSEYYRILGQINSELGNQDEAINSLIYSLKWNPKNPWALIMMGNIFSRFKKDVETAIIYYNEVIKNNPKDYLTLSNIGATLLQLGNTSEAKSYLIKAIEQNDKYPNAYFGLAIISFNEKSYSESFSYLLKTFQLNSLKDELYNNSIELLNQIVSYLSHSKQIIDLVNAYKGSLESKYDTNIIIEEDNNLINIAKIEIKENYKRDYHLIKYRSNSPSYSHLIIHELLHLELIEEAREFNNNSLFISNSSHNSKFKYIHSEYVKSLKKKGISDDNIEQYLTALFKGLNLQVFNTPIDLFIEDIIFNRFNSLQPIQFFSLFNMINEGIEATTRKDIIEKSPKDVLSISKIYNLVNALHFKQLYNIDLLDLFKASKNELNTADKFYNEFLEYRENREAGEEYEIIQHWAEDLNIDAYFELVLESNYNNSNIDNILKSISNDPYNLERPNFSNERKMREFVKNNTTEDVNLAVVMYMVDAINFFHNKNKNELKKIAFEFANLGMTGIDPNKDGYSILSIPNLKMTGYKTLAFYYVSWALGIPEMLKELQMPFDKEYKIAEQFCNMK
jgi:Flp pilus assembly protein TadD